MTKQLIRDRAGVILFSADMKNVLMVKPRLYENEEPSKAKWGFPKGSVEKNESMNQCASREFFEETGLYITIPKENSRNLYKGSCECRVYYYLYVMTPTMEEQYKRIRDVYGGNYATREISSIQFISVEELQKMTDLNSDSRRIIRDLPKYIPRAIAV
jgi:8-oxo-dGTP pyrophosphatase MutT (NUDIX family)